MNNTTKARSMKVSLVDEVVQVRAYSKGDLLGYVHLGNRGGWQVRIVKPNGDWMNVRDWFGNKNAATADLLRRLERTQKA